MKRRQKVSPDAPINTVWPRREDGGLFASLTSEQEDKVLDCMVICPNIDHKAEQILKTIAAQSPDKVVDFFGMRLAYQKGLQSSSEYFAIPYAFHDLSETLQQIPEQLVANVRRWFAIDNKLFTFRGGRMILSWSFGWHFARWCF